MAGDENVPLNSVEGQAALQRYFAECFDRLEVDEEADLPDPEPRLGHLVAHEGGRLHVGHKLLSVDSDLDPLILLCPPGSTGNCWREQRERHGKLTWVWVCDCH